MRKQILHYRILEKLGEGGGGTVYKAEDTKLDRIVVIKTLAPDLATNTAGRQRFLREARLASALDHPNICTIYEINDVEGASFIVMQYVEGRTLKELLAKGPLDLKSALSIAIQLADALATAHERGIIHRDMKSSNIIISLEGQCKILDFGLAKQFGEAAPKEELTVQGALLGTPSFMSPEQARGEAVDYRTDVFSLGIIMYEMITGERPFRGRSRIEVLQAVISSDPPPMSLYNARVSSRLEQIVRCALAKDRDGRYPRVRDMLSDLKQVARDYFYETGAIPGEVSAALSPPRHLGRSWLSEGTFIGRVFGRLFRTSSLDQSRSGQPSERSISSSWTTKERKTLAILPFKNLSRDPETDFYGFSFADSVIIELAKLQSLVLTPSSYVAKYQNMDIDPRQAGRELSVDAVLVGSYLKAGPRFRVMPQLVDILTGEILWTEKIDLGFDDIITLQDDVTRHIVEGLKLRISQSEQEQMQRPMTSRPDAYEFYLRGRHLLIKSCYQTYRKEDLDAAVQMFKQALELDPDFAQAHAGLGRCYANYVMRAIGGIYYYELAEQALDKALSLDDRLIDPRIFRVYIYLFKGQKELAREEIKELLWRAPNDATVHAVAANLYSWDGLYESALEQCNVRIKLFPVAAPEGYSWRGRILTYQGQYDKAITEFKKGLAIEPDHAGLKSFLAETLYHKGELNNALQLLVETLESNPNDKSLNLFLAMCSINRGEREKARQLLDEEVIAYAEADGDGAYWLGSVYALLGDKNEAVNWLERAIHIGYENYPWFERDSNLDPLREDLRFEELMENLGARWERLVGRVRG